VYSIYITLPLERASEGCFGRSVAAGSDQGVSFRELCELCMS